MRYQDRRFGQRRKLLEVLGNVYLLDNQQIPIFQTVHKFYTKLGYLLFTMRSTENWGVCSKVSGDFDVERYHHLLVVCKDLVHFIKSSGDIKETGVKIKSLRESSSDEEKADVAAENEQMLQIRSFCPHQKICKALNLKAILIESLKIDFNISFKGSRCTLEEKVITFRFIIIFSLLLK